MNLSIYEIITYISYIIAFIIYLFYGYKINDTTDPVHQNTKYIYDFILVLFTYLPFIVSLLWIFYNNSGDKHKLFILINIPIIMFLITPFIIFKDDILTGDYSLGITSKDDYLDLNKYDKHGNLVGKISKDSLLSKREDAQREKDKLDSERNELTEKRDDISQERKDRYDKISQNYKDKIDYYSDHFYDKDKDEYNFTGNNLYYYLIPGFTGILFTIIFYELSIKFKNIVSENEKNLHKTKISFIIIISIALGILFSFCSYLLVRNYYQSKIDDITRDHINELKKSGEDGIEKYKIQMYNDRLKKLKSTPPNLKFLPDFILYIFYDDDKIKEINEKKNKEQNKIDNSTKLSKDIQTNKERSSALGKIIDDINIKFRAAESEFNNRNDLRSGIYD